MDITAQIRELKKQRNAIILAHNYQLEEVQDVADYVGDSLYLSEVAKRAGAEVIVFCGVRFMAETAKILSPEKNVLLPEQEARCPLADMITADDVKKLKEEHPKAAVVCYVNSSAEVKAESDVCCTSGSAVKIVAALPEKEIIFVPDGNLGKYVASQVPEKEIILWKGHCITHAKVKVEDVQIVREKYPEARVVVHPECAPGVVAGADFVGSTSAIIDYVTHCDSRAFIIGTEMGILHQLKLVRPDGQFALLHQGLLCVNMKKTRIQSVYEALLHNQHQIQLVEELAQAAKRSLVRMMELV